MSALTLHYRTAGRRPRISGSALLTMGGVTRQVVSNCDAAQRSRIQDDLNGMAQRYLMEVDPRPAHVRRAYLMDLITVIQRSLKVDGVSVFLKAQLEDAVYCFASTGLVDRKGQDVPAERFHDVRYAAGEGYTGQCYAENRTIMLLRPDVGGHAAKFTEKREPASAGMHDPILLFPIPMLSKPSFGRERPLGVIRCADHYSPAIAGMRSLFSPADVSTIEFIAEQVSPILQTLNLRVDRELTVNVVKHDLDAPVRMIRDTIERVLEDLGADRKVREHDCRNIEVCAALIGNLADQLDPDPLSPPEIDPRPTFLEGDIVARMRNMLQHYARAKKEMSIIFGSGFRGIPKLDIDRDVIERALHNLVINAIKYGRQGSTIQIEARPPTANPSYFVVDVTNEGFGVEEGDRERIFYPRFRSTRARDEEVGAGLGLTMARQAMRAHGGNLDLTSLKNPTTFSLYFPKSRTTS